ncbi:MAG: MutS-related protein [Bacteroidales bacterium]
MDLTQQYNKLIDNNNEARLSYIHNRKYIPLFRLLLFLASIFFVYAFFAGAHQGWKTVMAVLSFGSFIFLGWLDATLNGKIELCDHLIDINRQEINSLNSDYSSFDPGAEYVNYDHPYTHDLDIFGVNSLFQCINRTATIFGKNRLADYFKNAWQFKSEIIQRQTAIRELSDNVTFRQQIRLIFYGQNITENDRNDWNDWLQSQTLLKHPLQLKILIIALPVLTITAIVLSSLGILPYQVPVFLVLIQFFFVTIYGKLTIKVHTSITSKFGILGKYAQCLELIEKMNFTSPHLQKLKEGLKSDSKKPPSEVIKRLANLMNMMDTNLNLFASAVMNGLFMFNLHLLMAVERWKNEHQSLINQWFEVIAEVDALSSLANFACNNPGYTYPKPFYKEFLLKAENIGHPLISKNTCVTNSIDIKGWNQFCIITGANMSGKSTFLRTIGSNCILAMMGTPVFADEFTFYPIEIHSSIRTSDSLSKNESYFYAELKRLKQIIGELEKGHHKLILLDEILKGTNSRDKQTGSIALIRQLLKYKLAGLFATHDLALGELKNHYPESINNLCFEIEIVDDQMKIDYKLREGICKNLNATFLMKNMGILLDGEGSRKEISKF